jgi:hypothetical protein
MPTEAVNASVLQFLDWLSLEGRTYTETMEAWRTHCPRLTVWEDALAGGLIEVRRSGAEARVVLTGAGISALGDRQP